MVLFYHPFIFSFCYGMGFILSITGMSLTLSSIFIFGSSKMQHYMILVDSIMLIQSIIARWMQLSNGFWITIMLLHATYMISFSIYPFFRCYPMMNKMSRISGYLVYGICYIGFTIYEMGNRGFITIYIGISSFIFTNICVFIFGMSILFKIVALIKENPMHMSSIKQQSIVFVFKHTVAFVFVLACPGTILALVGALTANNAIIDSIIGFTPLIGFVCVLSNVLVTANKSLEEGTRPASGYEVFSTTNHLVELKTVRNSTCTTG